MKVTGTCAAHSVEEFCYMNGISRTHFYQLIKDGKGPRLMKLGRRTLISHAALDEWQKGISTDGASVLPAAAAAATTLSSGPESLKDRISLRDHLAGCALAGGLGQSAESDIASLTRSGDDWWHTPEAIAKRAYEIADALLAQRSK